MFSNQDKQRAFGFHLMLDCYRCAPEHLDNIDVCYDFLDTLATAIGMTKQTQPYVFRTPEGFPGKQGLSGWVPLVESGISLHTLTESGFLSLDVYSCREFDCRQVVAQTRSSFAPEKIEEHYLLRGKEYR